MAKLIAELDSTQIWIWALVLAGLAGFLAGSFYRVGAVITLSFAVLVATIIIGVKLDWSFWRGALSVLGLIGTLQLGYLLGLILASTGGKLKAAVALRARWSALFKDLARR
ncbi:MULTISPECIES: hypothetical protein [Rhodomicrobium]|uniref:hypothetical protein n=1 Tax=Rhodomicrobium TaxID=1068 RepID=UPI000B4C1D50|nr:MULTISPECIES: hypothetical protein [Rhodomicrobium]